LGFSAPQPFTGVTSGTVSLTAGAATQIAMNAGNGQTATTGTAVAVPPSVIVRDASNNPVAGVAVTFVPGTGSGSVTGANPATDATGIAAVGSWMLGTTAGPNTLTATAPGLTGSPFTITASVAGATQMSVNGGDRQTGTVGQPLTTPLSVRVADQFNNPVAGVTISWAVISGAGSANPATSPSNASGIASTTWTLGTR